jgi:hypothetical protein
LSQWRQVNPVTNTVGLRYTLASGLDTILIIGDAGSMTLRVSGAWKI